MGEAEVLCQALRQADCIGRQFGGERFTENAAFLHKLVSVCNIDREFMLSLRNKLNVETEQYNPSRGSVGCNLCTDRLCPNELKRAVLKQKPQTRAWKV